MDNNVLWIEEQSLNRTKNSLENNNYEVHIINNKWEVVKNLDEVYERVRNYASPINARRLEKNSLLYNRKM